jgi:putative ABC transport system permease protein
VDKNTKRYYVKTVHEFNDSLKDALLKDEQIESIDTKSIIIERSNEMLSMLNQVILIILISSFALTSTVIYNLASINIVEREREIATLRVLGYTHREVKRLINSENYVLLTLGSILGLPVGTFLSRWISHMVSTNEFYMPDIIEPNVLIFSVFIAFIITFITNLILELKIRRIQLVESLKAVE